MHKASASEKDAINYFRFTAAPAFRTWCVGSGLEGFSTDYGLPKTESGLPNINDGEIALRMRYSHYGCNVVHEDVCVKAGAEVDTGSATVLFHECFFSLGGCRCRPSPPRPQGRGRGYRREAPVGARARDGVRGAGRHEAAVAGTVPP